MAKPFLLNFQPGIQRDGTQFDGNGYLDALWCRWRLHRPRKMNGYQMITGALNGVPRAIHCFYTGSLVYVHVGTASGIQQVVIDRYGNFVSIADRTPVGFIGGPFVGFTMDAIFDTTSQVVQLIAHAVPDLQNVASPIQTVPFLGQITSSTPLQAFSSPNASSGFYTLPKMAGGICCVQPFVFAFDNAGLLMWSAPNLPLYLGVSQGNTGAGQARISAQKIVRGMPLRGGGSQSPAAIFWTMSEVIIAVYVGSPAIWAFNTITPSSSILSSDAVIEYDGLYFWAGVGRFMVFNGTVAEVPNNQNQEWFFDNLTPGYEAKTFAYKVPEYGEIWFCAAMFGNTEPSHACIFNLRENCWYDTMLPPGGRSAGYFAQGVMFPIMAEPTLHGTGYRLWLHEADTYDMVTPAGPTAIRSYFETPWIGGPKNDPPTDQGISFQALEPDFIQTGDLSVTIISAANARSNVVTGAASPILAVPTVPQEQFASFTPTQLNRLLRLHVESNVLGGNYIIGRSLGRGEPSDARLTS